jgi:hypothetical protein
VTAVVGWKISSSYWLDECRCVVLVGRLIWYFVSICKRQGNGFLCERRRGKRRVWPWDIVKCCSTYGITLA